MNLYIRLITLKDRVKMRLLLEEAADLRRDILRTRRGSDARQALSRNLDFVNNTIRATGDRIAMAGYVGENRVASAAELYAVAAAALVALVTGYIVVAA